MLGHPDKDERAFQQRFMASRPAIFAPTQQPAVGEVPSFGVETVTMTLRRKQHQTQVYRQLDGSCATISSCLCDRGGGRCADLPHRHASHSCHSAQSNVGVA